MDYSKTPKGWKSFDFGQKSNKPESNRMTSKRTFEKKPDLNSNGHNKISKYRFEFNFEAKIAPKQINELAVHPKKLQELQACLLEISTHKDNHPQILLIKGPSGSGKLTSLKIICNEFGILIEEWINPIDQDFEITHENQSSQFLDFLIGSKWKSLFQKADSHITVVKDFPNSLIRNPNQFNEILEECWYKTKVPIVFVCTETNSKQINIIKNLFPDNIMSKYRIKQVDFNASAPTLMKNAIKRAQLILKEYPDLFSQPTSTVIEAVIVTSMGDLRTAMNQLYMSTLIGGGNMPLYVNKKEVIGAKRKKRNNADVKIKSMEKDELLGLFHGVGRVLNPKWHMHEGTERLNCDVEKIVDEFSIQPQVFISFLFENYLKYYGDFNNAVEAAALLSVAARFLDNFIDRQEILLYGLWVSVLGLLVTNRHKVSKWTQISGPVKIERKIVNDIHLVGFDKSDIFYSNLIKSSIKTDTNLSQTVVDYESDADFIIDDFDE